jgi:hypothetical protein
LETDLVADREGVGVFESLGEILDFVEESGAAVSVLGGRFAGFEHDGAADVAKSAEKHIAFVGCEFDLQQSIHRRDPMSAGGSGSVPVLFCGLLKERWRSEFLPWPLRRVRGSLRPVWEILKRSWGNAFWTLNSNAGGADWEWAGIEEDLGRGAWGRKKVVGKSELGLKRIQVVLSGMFQDDFPTARRTPWR